MTKLQEFTTFAGNKPADEKYEYMDCRGGCAVGQWMAATGVEWDIQTYNNLVNEALGGDSEPLQRSKTWGELHSKLKVFEPA